MSKGPLDTIKKKSARLARIAGLRGETLRQQQDSVRFVKMGPAFLKYIDAAAAGGCPIALNLIAQFKNCKWVLPDERRQGRDT